MCAHVEASRQPSGVISETPATFLFGTGSLIGMGHAPVG